MTDEIARYSRHTLLKMIGDEGQEKIRNSRVFVAGLGALGSMISMLLVRAGVGLVRIADQDSPELHNLHRQILYDEADVLNGLSKAQAAEKHLKAANSEVCIEAFDEAIGPENVDTMLKGVDLVIDALDNTQTRYLLNDAALEHDVPFIFGGAVETSGNVMVIFPGKTPCLRCLWPDPEMVAGHAKASSVGVLSSVATATASIEVTEALKILSGNEENVLSGLLMMDFWANCFHIAEIAADPACICRL